MPEVTTNGLPVSARASPIASIARRSAAMAPSLSDQSWMNARWMTPGSASPLDAVVAALDAVGPSFAERHELARMRQAVIDGDPRLRERELMKLAGIGAALATALRERGVDDLAADLAAETGVVAFRIGFARWVDGDEGGDPSPELRHVMAELRSIVAEP